MYWRQIAVSFLLGAFSAYLLHTNSYPMSVALSGGVIAYFSVRWFISWMFRIRYWYRRGTRGVYTRSCSNCGQYIYRMSGDWVITCHRCGWKAGYPILRLLTKSVPSIQLRRTVRGPQLLVVALAAVVVMMGGIPAYSIPTDDRTSPEEIVSGELENDPDDTSETPDSEPSEPTSTDDTLSRNEIELQIHELINEERGTRGLSELDFDRDLREIARYHSRDMGEKDYYSHISPSGEDFEDRYSEFGYNCKVPVSENRYLIGSENIGHSYRVGYDYDGNETLVANIFVNNWMNSDRHRENILNGNWRNHATGVYIVDEGSRKTIYATQNFC